MMKHRAPSFSVRINNLIDEEKRIQRFRITTSEN